MPAAPAADGASKARAVAATLRVPRLLGRGAAKRAQGRRNPISQQPGGFLAQRLVRADNPINPGFPGPGSTLNCAQCAIAVDLSLKAGRPLTAKPSLTPVLAASIEALYGRPFVLVSRYQLEAHLLSRGPGATGIVFGKNPTSGIGHFFNAVVTSQGVRYLDGQSGSLLSGNEFRDLALLDTSP